MKYIYFAFIVFFLLSCKNKSNVNSILFFDFTDDEKSLMTSYEYNIQRTEKTNELYIEALLVFLKSPDSLSEGAFEWSYISDDKRLRVHNWFSNYDSNWHCDAVIQYVEGTNVLDVVLVRDLIEKNGLDYELGIADYGHPININENIYILSGQARSSPFIYIHAKIAIILENGKINLYPFFDGEKGIYEYVDVRTEW